MRLSEIRNRAVAAGGDLPGTPVHAVWVLVEARLTEDAPELMNGTDLTYMGSCWAAPVVAMIENQTSTWRWPLVRRWHGVRRLWRRLRVDVARIIG